MTYMVQSWEHTCHLNQLKRRLTDLESLRKEVLIEILNRKFDVFLPPNYFEPRVYDKRKRTAQGFLNIEPKLKKYRLQRKLSQWGGVK